MGVLEQVDYDCTDKKLYDGDYVIMISDGVLDNLPCVNKEEKACRDNQQCEDEEAKGNS